MAEGKVWESEYNGKRYSFDKPLKVNCEIDSGWTAYISEWWRTMYPPNIMGFASRTVSSVTFNWCNGDAEETNSKVLNYETYWTWKNSGDTEEQTGGTIQYSPANSSNYYTRECGQGLIVNEGTPITLYAKVHPLDGSFYENHLLDDSFITAKTIFTLTRLPFVSNVGISGLTPSSFVIYWDEVEHAIGYELHLYLDDEKISTTTVNTNSATYTNLKHDRTYKVGIITNADGVEYASSLESPLVEVTMLPLQKLNPPRNIVLTARTETTLTFVWDEPESVEGLVSYLVRCNGNVTTIDKNVRMVTLTNLIEDQEYTVDFASGGDQIDWSNSDWVSVTATPMREKLVYYNAFTTSEEWIDNEYLYKIPSKTNNTPGNVYTTLLTGWTANTELWSDTTALTPATITIVSKTSTSISISFSTPQTDWGGKYVVGINEGRNYDNPTTTEQPKSNTTKTFNGLTPGTVYTISVGQKVESGNYFALAPATYTIRTMSQANQVENLHVINFAVTSLTFTWDSGGYGSGYDVYFTGTKDTIPTTSSTKVASLNYNTNQYVLNNLTGQSKFYLGVVTVGDGINFTNSDIVTNSDWTLEFVKLSGYTISNTPSGRSITVSWTQPSYGGTPTKYTIYSGINESSMTYVGTASTRNFKVSGLSPEMWYYIGVVANGDYIYNKDSDMVTIRAKTNALIPLAKPTITLTDSKTRQLTFEWTSVANSDGYLVKSGTTESVLVDLGVRVARTITLTGLEPDKTYYIAVAARAANDGNYKNSDYVTKGGATQPLITLEPPRNITVIDMTPTSIEFSYEAPASTNGLSGYTFYLNGSYYSSKGSGETKTIKFTNLTPDTEYTFGFQSTGDQIIGGDSRKEEVLQTPLSEKLVVSSYYFPGSDSWENNQYEYKISVKTNTTPGSVMTTVFKGWSAETNSFVYKTALTQVNISISNVDYNSVRVSYSTQETGWAGSYNIKVASGKTFSEENVVTSFTVSNSAAYSDVTNLREGLMYTVKVCQVLSNPDTSSYFVIGDGSVFTFKTKQHVEKATNLTASTIGVTSLTFTWDSATYALGYDVRFKQGQSISMSDPSTVVNEEQKQYTNLTGETFYTVGVVPKGDGINFGDATGMTSYTVKTADLVKLTGLSCSTDNVGQTQITLKWSMQNTDGVSGYNIYYTTATTMPSTPSYSFAGTSTTEKQITGLSANTRYYFWVVALGTKVYYKDSDPVSTNQKTLNLAQLPTPTLSKDSTTITSIKVKWDLVYTTANGSNVYASNYRIYYSTTTTRNDDNYVQVGSATTNYNFTNLASATTYYYWIQAIGDGVLTSSSTISNRTNYKTDTPPQLVVTMGDATDLTTTSVKINWSVNLTGSANISNIKFWTGSTSTTPTVLAYNATSRTVSGLQPSSSYTFTVQALGKANVTQDSVPKSQTITTKDLVQLAVAVTVKEICATTATISWEVTGTPIKNYDVYYKKSTSTAWSTQTMGQSSATTESTITGLAPSTTYNFKVVANGVAGSSLTGEGTVNGNTGAMIQLGINGLAQSASTKTSVSFKWDYTPSNATDVYYEIYSGNTNPPTTKIESSLAGSTKQYTINNLTSGETYYVKVAVKSTNPNYTPVTSSTLSLRTNYVDTSKTAYRLINFSASYNQIPASGTNGNYVTPLSSPAPSAKSVTAYTVVNYNGDTVSGDGYEETATINKPQLTFSGVPITNRTGLAYDSTTGGVKVDTRAGNYGASDWIVYRIYGLYNGTVSDNYVEVEQQSNTYEYGDYQAPAGASFTTKTVPASAYTITIGKTSTSTIYLNNASSVTQLRYKIYTSGYKDPDNSYKPGSYNITVGAVDSSSLSLDSLGTTPTGETNITVAVWYAANNQTATTNVVLTRSENKITSGSTITITNYSSNSSYNRIEVPAYEWTFYLQATGTVKFTSTATRPATPSDFVLINTLVHSRTYTSGTTSNSVSITFGTLGTNTVSSGNTTLTVKYKELSSPTKAVYFKELENKATGWTLDVIWDNFHTTMAWDTTRVSQKVNEIKYITSYSSRDESTSHPSIDMVTWTSTNNSFSVSVDTISEAIILNTTQNTSTSTDKTTQLVGIYNNGTYTSPTITQNHLVTVQQRYNSLQNAYTGSRFSLKVQQNSMTLDGWELYIDVVFLKANFLSPMQSGKYGVRMYVSDGEGFESSAINENSEFSLPSNAGYTTFELDDSVAYVIPGASKEGNFESGGTAQVCFELYSKSTGLVLSGGRSTWYTVDVD